MGAPSLPQITVSGYFTLTNAIGGPTAGGDFYSIRDVFSWTKARHAIKMGGELSYNKTIQDMLLNNYGVFTFNNSVTKNALADFMIGIPSAVTQDAPVTALWNSWYGAAFVQDDFRLGHEPDAEPRPALGRADARHRPAEPLHDLRAGPAVHRAPRRAGGPALLRRPRHRARRHPDQLDARLAARRHRVGSVRRRQDVDPRGGRRVLRQHLGQ